MSLFPFPTDFAASVLDQAVIGRLEYHLKHDGRATILLREAGVGAARAQEISEAIHGAPFRALALGAHISSLERRAILVRAARLTNCVFVL